MANASAVSPLMNSDVVYRSKDGAFPAKVVHGGEAGECRLVVFGAPKQGRPKQKDDDKTTPEILAAQIVEDVPFGTRVASEERKSLYPYWENN